MQKMAVTPFPGALLALAMLAGCSVGGDQDVTEEAEPPSQLDINSAKRQCNTSASMALIGQNIPDEAITQVCDCTVDRLVADGDFNATGAAAEAKADAAMETCFDQLEAQLQAAGPVGP